MAVVLLALLTSCMPRQLIGFYDANNGDTLLIERDGELLWSPLSNTMEDFIHIGMVSYDERTNVLHLVTASASPFFRRR